MYQASLGPFRLNHDPVKEGATADQFLFTDQKTGSQKGASPSRGHMARNGSLERAQQQGCRWPQLCGPATGFQPPVAFRSVLNISPWVQVRSSPSEQKVLCGSYLDALVRFLA